VTISTSPDPNLWRSEAKPLRSDAGTPPETVSATVL
jgi:hypothetical protein